MTYSLKLYRQEILFISISIADLEILLSSVFLTLLYVSTQEIPTLSFNS